MEKIEDKDLYMITVSKMKIELATAEAEKYVLTAKLADSQFKNTVNNIFMKYGLSQGDIIDEKTGEITRAKKEEENNGHEGTG